MENEENNIMNNDEAYHAINNDEVQAQNPIDEKERAQKNNEQNLKNAADIAIATKNPYAMAAGAAVKLADKVTGGKSTELASKAVTNALDRAPGGKFIQNKLNKINESGLGDKAGQAASMMGPSKGAGAAEAGSKAAKASEFADKANKAADQIPDKKNNESSKESSEVLNFAKKNPRLIFLLLGMGGFFLIFLIILFAITGASDESNGSIGYYDTACNYNDVIVVSPSCNSNVDLEDLSIDDYVKKITSIYLRNGDYSKQAILALMIAIKTNALSYGNYISDNKRVTVDFCTIYPDAYIERSNEKDLDSLYSEVEEYIYLSNSYLSEIQSLNSYNSLELSVAKLNEFESYAKSGNTYNEILNLSYNNLNGSINNNGSGNNEPKSLYKLSDYCVKYSINENSNSFWFPIGSLKQTKEGIYGGVLPQGTVLTSNHSGIDITNEFGNSNNVIAVADGVIEKVVNDCNVINNCSACGNDYGNYIIINHGNNIKTLYAHLSYGSLLVKVNDRVKQGQKIANMGATGCSTDNHLHFEVRVNNNTVNPAEYVNISDPRPVSTVVVSGSVSASSNKQSICLTLKKWNFNNNAVSAMLVNISHEGAFLTTNLENCYENGRCCKVRGKDYGYCVHKDLIGAFGSDSAYTNGVDSGKYPKDNFVNDRAGYGLIQWTSAKRKKGLYELAKQKNKSIGDIGVQLEFLVSELKNSYKSVYQYLLNTASAEDKTYNFCAHFEKPSNTEKSCNSRKQEVSDMSAYVSNGCK